MNFMFVKKKKKPKEKPNPKIYSTFISDRYVKYSMNNR